MPELDASFSAIDAARGIRVPYAKPTTTIDPVMTIPDDGIVTLRVCMVRSFIQQPSHGSTP